MAKVLFIMRATTHFHYYRSIVEALVKRGHRVKVLFARFEERWSEGNYIAPILEFQKEVGKLEYGLAHSRIKRQGSITYIRTILNYHRNLNIPTQPRYFRERVIAIMPIWLRLAFRYPLRVVLRWSPTGRLMRYLEKKIPPGEEILKDIKDFNPAVVIASAGNLNGNSADVEYTKAAKYLGIPTVIPVISWDYLSTKGAIHIEPDRLLCWNRFHKAEAIKYHHFPEEKIRITGSPFFDKWFSELKPSLSRQEFCKIHGLAAEDPMIVYLGSTPNIALDESWVVADLRKALDDSSDPKIKKIQIILRPHPVHAEIYKKILTDGITVIPKVAGKMPDTKEALEIFYDTLYHSAAAIGINTQAMLDAIAAGKPVLAMIVEKYRARQVKTSYFHHISDSGGVYLPKTAGESVNFISELVAGHDALKEKRENLISGLIRPRGISAGEAAADEIENLIYDSENKKNN